MDKSNYYISVDFSFFSKVTAISTISTKTKNSFIPGWAFHICIDNLCKIIYWHKLININVQIIWFHPFFLNNLFSINKLVNHLGWFSGFPKFSFSNKIENQAERSLKSFRDKSLKKINVIWPNSSSVRADGCGNWHFSQRHYSRSINLLTTRRDFYRTTKYRNFLRSQMITRDHLQ